MKAGRLPKTNAKEAQGFVLHGIEETPDMIDNLSDYCLFENSTWVADSENGYHVWDQNQVGIFPPISFAWEMDGDLAGLIGVMRCTTPSGRYFNIATFPCWKLKEASLWNVIMESIRSIIFQRVARYQTVESMYEQ